MARGAIAGRGLEAILAAGVVAMAGLIIVAALPRTKTGGSLSAAVAALRHDPLDPRALRVLALAAPDPQKTRDTLEFVVRQTWRDGPTDAWLLRDRLARGDLAGALACADALLRLDADGETRPPLFGLLTAAANFVEARPALATRLSADPWWRLEFLRYLDAHGEPTAATLLLSDMAAAPRPPRPIEIAPLIERLVAARDYADAIAAWRGSASRGAEATAALRDGNFTQAWDLTPFTWRPATGVGATSEIRADGSAPAGRVLSIDYDGFGEPSLPAQLLVLPAGSWRVSWRARGDARSDEALYWRVRCADTGAVLAGGPAEWDGAAAPDWRPRSLTFTRPSDGCAGQWLELIAEPGERRAQVTASYAEFRLEPVVSNR